MSGKLFFLDKGLIQIRNSNGVEVIFHTPEDLEKYYSGSIDLSNEHYIDYEPDRRIFFYNNDPDSIEPLSNIYEERPEVPEYEAVIADVKNMKERQEDLYFDLSLAEARDMRLAYLKGLTYKTIMKRMPEWRQVRWNEYARIYEKKQSGQELSPTEQLAYDGFPEKEQTHEFCYQKVCRGLQWLQKCVGVNNGREAEIDDIDEVDVIRNLGDPPYPKWPN